MIWSKKKQNKRIQIFRRKSTVRREFTKKTKEKEKEEEYTTRNKVAFLSLK